MNVIGTIWVDFLYISIHCEFDYVNHLIALSYSSPHDWSIHYSYTMCSKGTLTE
jgi:hypothetical protein